MSDTEKSKSQLIQELADARRQITELESEMDRLRQSETLYRTVFENAPIGIGLSYPGRHVLMINQVLENIYGYSRQELDKINPYDGYQNPEDRDRLMAQLKQDGYIENFEVAKRRKDGSLLFVSMTIVPFFFNDEELYLTMALDISERVQTQIDLQRFRQLVESADQGLGIATLDGQVMYINPALARLVELENIDAAIGSDFELFYADEVQEKLRSEVIPALTQDGAWVGELMLRSASGRIIPTDDNFFTVRDSEGLPVGFADVITDITERKRAEAERARLTEQIEVQAQRVQQIIDTVPDGMLLLDAVNRIVLANPVAQYYLDELTEVGTDDILAYLGNRTLDDLLTSPPMQGLWHEVILDGQPPRFFEVIARSIETGPELGGWVLVIRDVTNERDIQEQAQRQERLAAVGQLAAGIAHDFNNILAIIVLRAELLQRMKDLPERVQDRLGAIAQQALRATDLIQQILDFSRQSVMERLPLDLQVFLKEQVKLLDRTLGENVVIDLKIDEDAYTINADPTRMQQIVMNLAVNARDAMPDGGNLSIKLTRLSLAEGETPPMAEMPTGHWACLTIADTGTGIPQDILSRVFDPFFTTKPPGKGTRIRFGAGLRNC